MHLSPDIFTDPDAHQSQLHVFSGPERSAECIVLPCRFADVEYQRTRPIVFKYVLGIRIFTIDQFGQLLFMLFIS